MLDLSPETEALARRLGEARGSTVDATIRDALETLERATPPAGHNPASRQAAFDRAIAAIAALPDLDGRSSGEIMDDLDPL